MRFYTSLSQFPNDHCCSFTDRCRAFCIGRIQRRVYSIAIFFSAGLSAAINVRLFTYATNESFRIVSCNCWITSLLHRMQCISDFAKNVYIIKSKTIIIIKCAQTTEFLILLQYLFYFFAHLWKFREMLLFVSHIPRDVIIFFIYRFCFARLLHGWTFYFEPGHCMKQWNVTEEIIKIEFKFMCRAQFWAGVLRIWYIFIITYFDFWIDFTKANYKFCLLCIDTLHTTHTHTCCSKIPAKYLLFVFFSN